MCAFNTKRGTGRSSTAKVLSLPDEKDSRPDKLRSTAPKMWARRSSPAAMTFSRSLGQVGDLLGSKGIFKIGSCSLDGGVVGE